MCVCDFHPLIDQTQVYPAMMFSASTFVFWWTTKLEVAKFEPPKGNQLYDESFAYHVCNVHKQTEMVSLPRLITKG